MTESFRVLKIARAKVTEESVKQTEPNQKAQKSSHVGEYSGKVIAVTSLKPLVERGALLASCTVSIDGHIKLRECLIMSQFGEERILMPRRSVGKLSVPAVELSKELGADVKIAVLSAWRRLNAE